MTIHPRHAALALALLLAACGAESPAPPTAPASATVPVPQPDELDSRRQIDQDTWQALAQRDFAALERSAATYRDPGQRTPSGLWKLASFYVATANYLRSVGPCIGDPAPAEELFARWDQAVPDSPTLPLVRAGHRLCMAYPEGGRLDPAAVEAVRVDLEARRTLADSDPHWNELRLRTAGLQGLSEAEYTQVLQDAVRRQPDYHETWFRAIDTAMWQDDVDSEIDAIARTATGAASMNGQELYARIYWYAASKHYGDGLFERSRVDWSMMRIGIDDILRHHPDAWNLNHFARFACLAGDHAMTAKLMRRIGNAPLREAWPSQAAFDACREGRFGPTPATAMR